MKASLKSLELDVKKAKESASNAMLETYKDMQNKYGAKVFDEFFKVTKVRMEDGREARIAQGFLTAALRVVRGHERQIEQAAKAGIAFKEACKKVHDHA